jgi:hypothetical protein
MRSIDLVRLDKNSLLFRLTSECGQVLSSDVLRATGTFGKVLGSSHTALGGTIRT